jgi:hypothetical protein
MIFKYKAESQELASMIEGEMELDHLHKSSDGEIHKVKRGTMGFFNVEMKAVLEHKEVPERDLSYLFEEEPLQEPFLFEEVYRLKGTEFLLHLNVFTNVFDFYWSKFIPNLDEEPEEVDFSSVYEGCPPLIQEELMFNFDVFGE